MFLKTNNVLLRKDLKIKDFNEIKMKVNVKNVATYYQIANYFNFNELAKLALCYIERCFTAVCENNNFLELDSKLVGNILASSELRIDSELQVLDAAEFWVGSDFEQRRKFAKNLLLKIRLPLLPSHHLDCRLSRDLPFNKVDDCLQIMREALQNKISSYQNKPKTFFSHRFCSQNTFNIILTGGLKISRGGGETYRKPQTTVFDSFQQVDGTYFDVVKSVTSMKLRQCRNQTIYCRGDIYVFGGYDNNKKIITPVEKYSFITNTWEHVGDWSDSREEFCACAFTDNILVIGGCYGTLDSFKSCLKFNTKDKKWNYISKMNDGRAGAACTVFEGRVVVSGGTRSSYTGDQLNTVEVYDHVANTWSYMPNMVEERYCHSSVAYKNKLFAIGSIIGVGMISCEVFDSACKKFVFLKQKPNSVMFSLSNIVQTLSIGSKLITLGHSSETAICYDVEKDEWTEERLDVTEDRYFFGCTVVPKM